MTPEQMRDILKDVSDKLKQSDDLSPLMDANGNENEWAESIGALLIAVGELSQVVRELVEIQVIP